MPQPSRPGLLLHGPYKTIEEITGIVRTGTGFGMVLHGKDRLAFHPQALDCAIEQRTMGNFDMRRNGIVAHGKSVVLAGDLDLAGSLILDRMVTTTVTKLQLKRLKTERL